MSGLLWLEDLVQYIRSQSYGQAAIRVMDHKGITYGIIEPYGYYVINYKANIFLIREKNIAIRFFVRDERVVTSLINTNYITMEYIDALFDNPPISSSKIVKFVLFKDDYPKKYSVIHLINRCINLRIFELQ